ncbi:MAG: 50S ribosomal protein L22 [Oligoflexia bacterium]|nr:50S ribosomal protein L22 [Oligoflexia bacterium]
MEIKSSTRFVRISPRKLRLVGDLVRGAMVGDALNTLKFTPKRGAKVLYKTVMSAVANAEQKGTVDVDSLYIKSLWVDGGPVLRRYLPRAQGRATIVRKRTSHLNVILGER